MIIYILIINLITLIIFKIDKKRSIKHESRIKESTLIILSAIGGSIGAILGMNLFHHKTKKIKFKILIPLTLLIWIYIIFIIYR